MWDLARFVIIINSIVIISIIVISIIVKFVISGDYKILPHPGRGAHGRAKEHHLEVPDSRRGRDRLRRTSRAHEERADHEVRDPVLEGGRPQQEEAEADHRPEDGLRQPGRQH